MSHLLFLDSLHIPPVLIKVIVVVVLYITYKIGFYEGKKAAKKEAGKK